MPKKSLAAILRRQWWLHTCLTSLFFIAVAFFFFFAIEDFFHEKQLTDISRIVSLSGSTIGLPEHIQMFEVNDAPKLWVSELEQVGLNVAIEINQPNWQPIHIIKSQFSIDKQVFILVLYTTKTSSIWAGADKLLMMTLPWIVIFLAIASFLAKNFIGQIQRHFKQLLSTIKQSRSPEVLQQFAADQPINELAQFGQLFAQVWQQKVSMLNREKQRLEYLSHELRTPIQSSLATLELLALKTQDNHAIARITRSLNRMTRLANAILYLMDKDKSPSTYPVDVFEICLQIVDELKPLADIKKQTMTINTSNADKTLPLKMVATDEVIETLLSILLTNALQHGNGSAIVITINDSEINVKNVIESSAHSQYLANTGERDQGFGIGLIIAEQLAQRFSLKLSVSFNKTQQSNDVVLTCSATITRAPISLEWVPANLIKT
jgi:signal transduction histidine kinase